MPWFNTDRVDVTMEHGVVHLDGHVDSIHTVLALRRLAAAMPDCGDRIWVDSE